MSVTDDPQTLGRTRLSFASEADIDEFVATLEKFESGELAPDQWRMFRLLRGTYGQRQPGDVNCASRFRRACSPGRSSRRSPRSASGSRAASATSRPVETVPKGCAPGSRTFDCFRT